MDPKTLYWTADVRHERGYTLLFHLYEVHEQAKLNCGIRNQDDSYLHGRDRVYGWGEVMDSRPCWKCPLSGLAHGYSCGISLNLIFKRCVLYICYAMTFFFSWRTNLVILIYQLLGFCLSGRKKTDFIENLLSAHHWASYVYKFV